MIQWLSNNIQWWYAVVAAVLILGLWAFSFWFAMGWGAKAQKRQVRQVAKKRESGATDFVIRPAADGYMEIMLSKKQYKKLRGEPLVGLVQGSKSSMAFRLGVL